MLNPRPSQPTIEKTLLDFSEGRISRQRAMFVLDVDYSELWDLMVAHDLWLPELSDLEAASEGHRMADFLAARGI
ncbi:hypothetical protein [Neorhizobium sp. JUb45]|uniref:hypothetical protein n=1 Tax=unclassified Neorhizobium TaxID=2629175 RepID=UPI00104ADC7F|nr:hypothetical protein [Neorhizobium sp. JUb45]TCR00003.1 hypothetical protein EDF70_10780 [Neorhizobium sp. JUb45]